MGGIAMGLMSGLGEVGAALSHRENGAAKIIQSAIAENIAAQRYGDTYNRALSTYTANRGTFADARDSYFNKNYSLAQLGYGATDQSNTAYGNYGANASGLTTGYGQNQANLTTGSGNVQGQNAVTKGNLYGQIPGYVAGFGNNSLAYYYSRQPQGGFTNLGPYTNPLPTNPAKR
jgi:hypothetical protein